MCFYFENPYTGAILRFCLVACWTRRINMESPQTVPKDALPNQIPPGNLLLKTMVIYITTKEKITYRVKE